MKATGGRLVRDNCIALGNGDALTNPDRASLYGAVWSWAWRNLALHRGSRLAATHTLRLSLPESSWNQKKWKDDRRD